MEDDDIARAQNLSIVGLLYYGVLTRTRTHADRGVWSPVDAVRWCLVAETDTVTSLHLQVLLVFIQLTTLVACKPIQSLDEL